MEAEESIGIMKALGDKSRLAIINSLLDRPQYVEEIASRHALAPSTVSFHLRKLEKAGLVSSRKEQYYVVFAVNEKVFSTTLREIVAAPQSGRELQDERMEGYRRTVLGSFFRNGRLEKLPAQHKKRLIVLEEFALRFEPGRRFTEQEVTSLITPLYEDYCTVRRLLVDEGLLRREGSAYWRDAAAPLDRKPLIGDEPFSVRGEAPGDKESRARMKRAYKEKTPDMGVYEIRNKVNGKVFVASTTNLEGTRNSRLFQLRMGKIVFNRELQQDLNQFGAEAFEYNVLAVLDPLQPGERAEEVLAALELQWLDKVQPFGDRGYNSVRKYQKLKGMG